jgi:HSP20 family protein
MTDIAIHKVTDPADRSRPVFAEVDRLMEDIGRRAREICDQRGAGAGHALDDWLEAEREFCWPAAQLVEREEDFVLSVALAGYAPSQVDLTATPREVVVHARSEAGSTDERREPPIAVRWSEFRSSDVMRHVELPQDVDPVRAKASLKHGMLRITLPKIAAAARLPVASAA